jgi:hypothetical protein
MKGKPSNLVDVIASGLAEVLHGLVNNPKIPQEYTTEDVVVSALMRLLAGICVNIEMPKDKFDELLSAELKVIRARSENGCLNANVLH